MEARKHMNDPETVKALLRQYVLYALKTDVNAGGTGSASAFSRNDPWKVEIDEKGKIHAVLNITLATRPKRRELLHYSREWLNSIRAGFAGKAESVDWRLDNVIEEYRPSFQSAAKSDPEFGIDRDYWKATLTISGIDAAAMRSSLYQAMERDYTASGLSEWLPILPALLGASAQRHVEADFSGGDGKDCGLYLGTDTSGRGAAMAEKLGKMLTKEYIPCLVEQRSGIHGIALHGPTQYETVCFKVKQLAATLITHKLEKIFPGLTVKCDIYNDYVPNMHERDVRYPRPSVFLNLCFDSEAVAKTAKQNLAESWQQFKAGSKLPASELADPAIDIEAYKKNPKDPKEQPKFRVILSIPAHAVPPMVRALARKFGRNDDMSPGAERAGR